MECRLANDNHREAMSTMTSTTDFDDHDEMLDINVLSDEFVEMTEVIMQTSPRMPVWEARKLALRMLALFASDARAPRTNRGQFPTRGH